MFDTTLIASDPRRELKRKFATLPAALTVHAIALGFVMVSQLWAVDQVPEVVPVQPLFVHILPPMGGGADDRTAGHQVRRAAVARVPRAPIVQPQAIPPQEPKRADSEPALDNRVPWSDRFNDDDVSSVDGPLGPWTGPPRDDVREAPPVVGPIQIGGNVRPPIPIEHPAPRYPDLARRLRIQGMASLEAVIDEEGNVIKVRLTSDPGFGCGQAALEAVQSWRYKPATLNGHAVAVYLTISVTFQLAGVG